MATTAVITHPGVRNERHPLRRRSPLPPDRGAVGAEVEVVEGVDTGSFSVTPA